LVGTFDDIKSARGRPKIMRTGIPGRPKKQYHIANIALNIFDNDPETIKDMWEIPDKER